MFDCGQFICILAGHGGLRECAGSQRELALSPVADDVNGIDLRSARQRCRDLLHPILPTVQHDNLDIRTHAGDERLIIRHRGIDEGDFGRGLAGIVGGDGLKQVLRFRLRCGRLASAALYGHSRLGLLLRHLFLIDFSRRRCCRGVEHETRFEGEQ